MACCAVSGISSSSGVWPVLCSGGGCIGGGGGGGWASHGGVRLTQMGGASGGWVVGVVGRFVGGGGWAVVGVV